MSESHIPYVVLAGRGEALIDDIDDFVDEWHESDTNETLPNFLGMSDKEYKLWVQDDNFLPAIIKAHLDNISIEEVLSNIPELQIAARSENSDRFKKIIHWLKNRNE